MTAITPSNDPAKAPPMINEADIGSGEKTPGELETEKQIQSIPPLPESPDADKPTPPPAGCLS